MARTIILTLCLLLTHLPASAGSFMESAAGKIHYEFSAQGNGPAVVLVHGFSTPMWVWEPLYQALAAEGRQVLRFDLFGRGQSERAGQDSLTLFREQIDLLREHLGLQQPVDLVGLSMGGAITASYVAENPGSTRRVVLIAPFNTPKNVPILNSSPLGEWLAEYVLVPIALRWGYRNNFADPDTYLTNHPEVAEKFSAAENSHDYSMALLSSLRNIISRDPLAYYERVGVQQKQLLLIWGTADDVVPFEQSTRVMDALGEARFLPVTGAGHLPHLEKADAVVPEIVEFLR